MGTKFKANVGTQPNTAGLQQIAPGSARLPQSFLNGIGRTVDRATLRPSGDSIFAQLAGGTVITPLDQSGSAVGVGYPHPFKVLYAGKPTTGSKVFVRILEGHILGRLNFTQGYWFQERPFQDGQMPYTQRSIGIPGIDTSWEGGWPSGPEPDTSAGNNPTNPGNTTTEATKSGAGTHYTTANGYQSGNAGSVTNPNQGSSGIYHTTPSVTGNGNYVSGNAGSITNTSQGNYGIYHTPLTSTGNGTYVGGNAGSITNGGNSSSVYNPPLTKSP